MAITLDDDHEIYRDGERIMFPRDGNHSPAAFMAGFDVNEDIVFGQFTADGRLKVDASVTIDSVDIGDVNMLLKVGGVNRYWDGVLNPDAITYAGYTQDQRMTFSGGYLNVNLSATTPLVQTTITRDPVTNLVSQIEEDDGLFVKTSAFTRDANNLVTFIGETII